jgi:hypothetical protein
MTTQTASAKIEKFIAPIYWTSDLVELRINVNKGEGFRMRSELRIGVDSFESAIKLIDWLRRRGIDCNTIDNGRYTKSHTEVIAYDTAGQHAETWIKIITRCQQIEKDKEIIF